MISLFLSFTPRVRPSPRLTSLSPPLLTHLPLTVAPHSRPLTAGFSSHRRLLCPLPPAPLSAHCSLLSPLTAGSSLLSPLTRRLLSLLLTRQSPPLLTRRLLSLLLTRRICSLAALHRRGAMHRSPARLRRLHCRQFATVACTASSHQSRLHRLHCRRLALTIWGRPIRVVVASEHHLSSSPLSELRGPMPQIGGHAGAQTEKVLSQSSNDQGGRHSEDRERSVLVMVESAVSEARGA
ncbi:hypothetical protein Syun_019790 [Stephania yunnanensis]|uniref:Uncharacterized protein n=1 Tax=Stephania yunnanensis TaxID=152371 RepID=A0AAP0IUU0_9MAGN